VNNIKPWTAMGLMTAGLATSSNTFKRNLQSDVQDIIGTSESDLDDYLAFVPSGQVLLYALNKNNTDRLYHLKGYAYSTAINLGATWALKSILNVERPRGGNFAFPSGHTSFAFSTATASYMALRDKRPVLAWVSFAPAAVVGVMRVRKNRHWVPDVLFGAGLGIISTQLTYRYLVRPSPTKEAGRFLSNLHFDIAPSHISLVYQL
jgi:membrane-associated phospholipid phosphatase